MTTWKDIELEIRRGETMEHRLITALSAVDRHTHDFIGVLPHGTATATIELSCQLSPGCQALLDEIARVAGEWDLYNDCRYILAGDLYGWVPARRGRWGHMTTGSGRVIPIDSIGEVVDEGDGTVSCEMTVSPWWEP